MASNPYAVNNFSGKFKITYAGLDDGFECFRVHLAGHKAMNVHMFKVELATWVLEETFGKATMGNGFGDSARHPNVNLYNPDGTDVFVLFEKIIDVRRFEEQFPVTGYSPTMVI